MGQGVIVTHIIPVKTDGVLRGRRPRTVHYSCITAATAERGEVRGRVALKEVFAVEGRGGREGGRGEGCSSDRVTSGPL